MSDDYDFPPPSGEPVAPPPGPDAGWDSSGPARPNTQVSGTEVLSNGRADQDQEAEQQRNRVRVGITLAALVATLGAIIFGFAITSGHGSKPATSHAVAGSNPNAVVDPPSASATGLPVLTGIPAAPSALDSASAMASAQAAEKAFTPPTVVPSDVHPYTANAPIDATVIPPFLTVTIPGIQAKDAATQALATQFEEFLKAWVEAWASGNVDDPRYRAWCADQCLSVTEPTIALWKNANIVPAGTLRFFEMAGGIVNGGFSALAGVCVDDSQLTALRNGVAYQNPYPMAGPTLYVFGLVNDKATGRWVISRAYASPGDSYCASAGSGSTS